MQIVALLVFLLPVAMHALCPSDVRVEVTDTSLHVEFSTDTAGRATQARLRYGAGTNMPRQGAPRAANHATARSRALNVADLRPGLERLYFDPQVSDPQGARWSDYGSCQAQLCPSAGAQQGGYSCEPDGKGGFVPFVSLPPDSGALAPPEPPRHVRQNPREKPPLNGKITKLTDCSAVQQALDDHAAGGSKDPNLNHVILLPEGRICRPEQESSRAGKNLAFYTLPPKTGSGVTTITCDWKPLHGPPPGVQYTPELRGDSACGFGLNHETVRDGSAFEANGALFLTPKCAAAPCTRGWRFETLVIEAGDWRDYSPRTVAVTSVNAANGRIQLAESIDGLYTNNSEMILNLPGISSMVWGHGAKPHLDFNARGCMAIQYSSKEIGCWGVERMAGDYKGGGHISAAQGYPIRSCSSEAGAATCTLEAEHGLGNFHAFSIANLSGGQLTVDAEAHGWSRGAAILIEGASACNGIHIVASTPTPQSAKLAQSGCSGSGGTARRLYTGRFLDLEGAGAEALEGVRLIDFPGPRQVRAFETNLNGAAIDGGGFVYSNPKISNFFAIRDAAGLTWDRVLFNIGAPFRVFNVIGIATDRETALPCDCAIVDSFVEGLHFWQPITPHAGVVDGAQTFTPFSAAPAFVRAHVVKDLQLDGIVLRNSAGFAFFADQFGAPGPEDVTFRRIAMTLPDELVAGPLSKGIAYNLRHFIEVKAGVRLLLEGLQVQNWAAVGVSGAAPIFFSYRTADPDRLRLMQDLTIRNIFLRNVPVGIAIRTTGADGSARQQPIRRVLLDNVLIDGVDYPNRQAAPHDQTLAAPSTFYETPVGNGSALSLGGPAENVRVTRVTARRLRSKDVPNFLWLQDDRSNGIQVDRSIISYSPSGPELDGVAAYAYSTQNLLPPVTGGGAKSFFDWATWMGEPDPRSWFGSPSAPVGVIPCLPDSNTPRPDFQRRNNAKSLAERAFACSGKDCGRWNIRIAGKDRQSCAEREAQVLDKDLSGIGPFEGLGANIPELGKALGYVPAQLTDVTSSGAKLNYAPLSADVCIVDHGRDPSFGTFVRGQDSGGPGARGVLLGGYAPGETAYYRLLCPQSVQVWGRFKTAEQ
jgi:hypothetical protein